jgi:hypothetical protein
LSYLKINNFQAKPIHALPPPKEVVLTFTINPLIPNALFLLEGENFFQLMKPTHRKPGRKTEEQK